MINWKKTRIAIACQCGGSQTAIKADVIAASMVAYAEAHAAFARLRRERPASGKRHRERVGQLDRDWDRYQPMRTIWRSLHSIAR